MFYDLLVFRDELQILSIFGKFAYGEFLLQVG